MSNPLGLTSVTFEGGEGDQPLPSAPPSTPTSPNPTASPSVPPPLPQGETIENLPADLTATLETIAAYKQSDAALRQRISELTAARDAAQKDARSWQQELLEVAKTVDQAILDAQAYVAGAKIAGAADAGGAWGRFQSYVGVLLVLQQLKIPSEPSLPSRGNENPSTPARLALLRFSIIVGMLVMAVFGRIKSLPPPSAPTST